MGLRYRKSITLFKGVRLNIGKNGVSLSAGIPGFRKTIHSSGRVTTSVGIPGTGLYYVDTKNPKKQNKKSKPTSQRRESYEWNPKEKIKRQKVRLQIAKRSCDKLWYRDEKYQPSPVRC